MNIHLATGAIQLLLGAALLTPQLQPVNIQGDSFREKIPEPTIKYEVTYQEYVPKAVESPRTVVTDLSDGMAFIFQKESGNRLDAVSSSGACGLGQSLPCSKLSNVCPNWRIDRACQESFFTSYAVSRYSSWSQAKLFWLSRGWW